MGIKALILIPCALICVFTHAQQLSCEKLIKKLEADSKKNKPMWAHNEFSNDNYYCAGKYFAQQDIRKGIYRLRYWGFFPWDNPCVICNYKKYDFDIEYDFTLDIYDEAEDNFFKGYNEIAKAFLKIKVGDSIFNYLENIPWRYPVNMRDTLYKIIHTKNKLSQSLDVQEIDSVTINVKINIDTLFKDYPELIHNTIYHLTLNKKIKSIYYGPDQTLDYKKIKEIGFRLIKQKNNTNKYVFDIGFDFKNIMYKEKYCSCVSGPNTTYSFIIPIIIER